MNVIGRALRVQRGEGRLVALHVVLMVVSSAGLTIGESSVSALFLDRLGAQALPSIYLAQGGVGLAAMVALTSLLGRVRARRLYVVAPLAAAGIVLAQRALLTTGSRWVYQSLWLTVTVVTLVQAVVVWGTAGLATDTRSAKRLFPIFSAGAILGAVAGGAVTRPLAGVLGADNLLVVWAAAIVIMAAAGRAALRAADTSRGAWAPGTEHRRTTGWEALRAGMTFVRRSRLLTWMTVGAVLFSILFYSLFLPFAQVATERYTDPDRLAGFFGVFGGAVTAAALLISILVANRLLVWLGAASLILLLPMLYAGSFATLLISSTLPTLVAGRFAVNVWMQGVAAPAWETVVNVVPPARRDQTRAFLNGGPTQIGTAIAGITYLVGQEALSPRQLSIAGLVVAIVAIAVTWRIRRSYAGALVDALRAGRPTVFEPEATAGAPIALTADRAAIRSMLDAAGDPDPWVRRLAVELLPGVSDQRARATAIAALDDDDPLVRANAVRAVGRLGGDGGLVERAGGDPDPAVRRAAVEIAVATTSDGTGRPPLWTLLDDADPRVAAAAAVALLSGPHRIAATSRLAAVLADDAPQVRITVLDELRSAPADVVEEFVAPLADDRSVTVRSAALETLCAVGAPAAQGLILRAIEAPEAPIRAAAMRCLPALDRGAVGPALEALAGARAELAAADRSLAASIPADGEARILLRDALLERGRARALVALSALAALSGDREAARTALENLGADDARQGANAVETIEVVVGSPMTRPLLELWEEAGPPSGSDDWMAGVLVDEDPFIRACGELAREEHRGSVQPGAAGDAPEREKGEDVSRIGPTLTPMERVLALRRVALFASLAPSDLARVAMIAEERTYADGERIVTQGEDGDELHIVVAGTVRVEREGNRTSAPVALRVVGDVVGEMSIIRRQPRMATLVAQGDVRTVRIGRAEFESIIRERPDVSLGVMRVLAERLHVETTRDPNDPAD